MIQAGLDGIKKEMDAGEAESRNLYEVEDESVPTLPTNLKEALGALNKDDLLLSALGEHTSGAYIEEKQKEWTEYSLQVSKWEIEKYMNK